MTVTIHPGEPNLETLMNIRKELFTAESTSENVKKIKAIDFQIARHEKLFREQKAAEKAKK